MDKGAHFYKTDFQIHTPRDPSWVGCEPVEKEDRIKFARRFVEKCRELDIQSVGITEHHDICFIEYFQMAAQDEDILTGVDPKKQRPIIFPGIEVTLQVPCQAIILLDADSDKTMQFALIQLLNLQHLYKENEKKCQQPQPLPFHSLQELQDKINENTILRNRFIILPHVCNDGHKTLLRKGFQDKYKSMPCVGGYIERDWEELDDKNKNIVNGIDPMWGPKPIGVFQTTDSRREDFSEIGRRNTWVKFAQPTAEGLRQACLARESRISQDLPSIPSRYISHIKVSNSTFMGGIDFEFNPQLNTIIGGRGTGKSTILEYLRWAMQDQRVDTNSDIEPTDGIAYKRKLIQDTLIKIGGTVTVHWNIDGIPHIVISDSSTNDLILQIGKEQPEFTTSDQLRSMLPIRAYSQKQLSSVSIRTAELQRFVEQPVQEKLEKVKIDIKDVSEELRRLYSVILQRKGLEKELKANKANLISARERATALEKSLPKLTEKAQKALAEHAARLQEKQATDAIKDDLNDVLEMIESAEESLSSLPRTLDLAEDSPQLELLQEIHTSSDSLISRLLDGLKKLKEDFLAEIISIKTDFKKWEALHEAHQKAYQAAQEEASTHKEKMKQIRELRTQEAELRKKISTLEQKSKLLPDSEAEFASLWESWCEMHKIRGDILEEQCKSLSEKSGGDIRAELVRGADINSAMEKLDSCLKGTRISQERWEKLRSHLLKSGSVVETWRRLMSELRVLAEAEIDDYSSGKLPDVLKFLSLTPNQMKGIIERLKPELWLEIALTSLNDLPRFYYVSGKNEIPFDQASAGQQATALLKALLHESGGPLIIDQPEEDLDNAVIEQIITELRNAKQKRQIIVTSHNANLVVNGDAELVIHCDYYSESNRSKGEVKHLGAIDDLDIKDVITSVMEGGRKAFELRKQKYGF